MELRIISINELKDLTGPCLYDILMECFRKKDNERPFSFQKNKEELGFLLYEQLLCTDKLTFMQKREIDRLYTKYLSRKNSDISLARKKWQLRTWSSPKNPDEKVALRISKMLYQYKKSIDEKTQMVRSAFFDYPQVTFDCPKTYCAIRNLLLRNPDWYDAFEIFASERSTMPIAQAS